MKSFNRNPNEAQISKANKHILARDAQRDIAACRVFVGAMADLASENGFYMRTREGTRNLGKCWNL